MLLEQSTLPLIRFVNVSKRFELNRQETRSLISLAPRLIGRRQAKEYFWPLRDINLEILPGKTVGIIGENGSGKSTLLKLISRILEPTEGVIEVNGRVSALLELGAGFHPELTGRENIFLHASLLGLQRNEINAIQDAIVDFADIGQFIDTPVKHYSSGMYARLGFAIAIYVEPQVLLVDEVLAVGDESFQRRCLDAIHRLQARGVTILVVSHSLPQIVQLCDQCIWLDQGKLRAIGVTLDVVRAYLAAVDEEMAQRLLDENMRRLLHGPEPEPEPEPFEIEEVVEEVAPAPAPVPVIELPPRRWGRGPIRIERVQMLNAKGKMTWSFEPLERATVKINYRASEPVAEPVFSILIHKLDGHYLWASNTTMHPIPPIAYPGYGELLVQISALALTAGRYFLSAAAYPEPDPPLWPAPSDFHEQLYEFQVLSECEIHGDLIMPNHWEHSAPPAPLPLPHPVQQLQPM